VAALNRIVVGMPAFTDPHNPMTQSGSINLPLDKHPVTHSEDFAQEVPQHKTGAVTHSPMAAGAATLEPIDLTAGGDAAVDLPADREDWQKKHWQAQADAYGLPTSGNTDAVKDRVEEHEAMQEAVDARGKELHAMSRDDLDKAAKKAGLDPAAYSNKESLADAVLAAESD
jgi:hypothetical protein